MPRVARSARSAVCRTVSLLSPILFLSALLLSLFCAGSPSAPAVPDAYGSIEIRARIVAYPLSKGLDASGASRTAATVADTLVVEVSGSGLVPTQIKRRLDLSRPSVIDTVTKVPVGKNMRVAIWAIDKGGKTTHIDSIESRTVNIEAATATPVFATLIPAAGSIYLQLSGLPAEAEAVHASFSLPSGEVISENRVAKSLRTFLSIDNILHETEGVLRVSILGAAGDTILIATETHTFNARLDNAITLQFVENSGMLGVDVAMYAPGVTTATHNFKVPEPDEETGELIITEIMWNAGNDNYLELYNPKSDTARFETLTTDIDGTVRDFADVKVAPKGYVVLGRQKLPYVDYHTDGTGGLPITTTGNWITVKRGRSGPVIDRVICASNAAQAMGWPVLASSNKRSIELVREKYDAFENNYGKNWRAATELIEGQTTYYGTPGR